MEKRIITKEVGKMNTRKKEYIEFFEKCNLCGREMSGRSESQVKYNLKIHMDAEHNVPLQNAIK